MKLSFTRKAYCFRRLAPAAFAFITLLGSLEAVAQQIDDGTYSLRSKHSGKYLDLLNASTIGGGNIAQWTEHGLVHQNWHIKHIGDGKYSIISASSGMAAEAFDWGTSNGSNIAQWDYWGGDLQLWKLQDRGDGYFSVINAYSDKAMEVYDFATFDGANVSQWEYSGIAPQLWAFESLDTGPANHWESSGDLLSHDPTLIEENGKWFEFHTGAGLNSKVSDDGISWSDSQPLIPNGYSWWNDYVPNHDGIDVWAPDVKKYKDKTYLYYSISTFGSPVSAIGLLTTDSVESGTWEDEGLVIATDNSQGYNAIDPDLVIDAEGSPWLAFGSWFSGIKLTKLDESTMKPTGELYSIADRGGLGIEGASITYRNGYYYLFASFDHCCSGLNSTYNIRYGRSTSITGPYLDKSGNSMLDGGGELFDNGTDLWIGPGGQDIIGNHTIVRHAYDATDNGNAKLLISKLNWDENGWPRY